MKTLNMSITFQRAERKIAKARIALCSPAGGGKTYSALLLAKGLGEKIAVIDTENGSASMEAGKEGMPQFDVLTMHAPFSPDKYVLAMRAAEEAGYDVIVIDSLSHAWAGTGGLLEEVDKKTKASKSGNSYTAWRDVTPMHNRLVEAILQSKCHIIGTMRSKAEYVVEKDEKTGRTAPKKVGLAPIQREGMDYEFTIVFDIDQSSHLARASKDRTSLFADFTDILTEDTGKKLSDWLNEGVEVVPSKAIDEKKAQVEALMKVHKPIDMNITDEDVAFVDTGAIMTEELAKAEFLKAEINKFNELTPEDKAKFDATFPIEESANAKAMREAMEKAKTE